MSKLIYTYGEDARLLDVLTRALRENGYTLEYMDTDSLSPQISADIALSCRPCEQKSLIHIADLTLDVDSRRATGPAGDIHFTPTEFAMLAYLMRNEDRAVPRAELMPAIWGFANDRDTRVADDTAKRIRRKLQPTHLRLETVWGYGFRIRTE